MMPCINDKVQFVYPCNRKRFTESENQTVLRKVIAETKAESDKKYVYMYHS